MPKDLLTARITIRASAETIFTVLADPARHVAIDGTGWIQKPLDQQPIGAPGQIFRMAMYHPKHPNGDYEMANQVTVFEPPRAIAWKPGYDAGGGKLGFGGWFWRYDLISLGPSETEVTLSYDWSSVSAPIRQRIGFPPFSPDHLDNSLTHLAELATSGD